MFAPPENELSPIELVAEGMFLIAAGAKNDDLWERLSEPQKDWWRTCARQITNEWIRAINASDR